MLEAAMADVPGKGRRQEFDGSQLERARLLKALLQKGVSFARLSATDLGFDGQAFVVYDGHQLRACQDAAAANRRDLPRQTLVLGSRSVRDPAG
jgi:hypothetical protein